MNLHDWTRVPASTFHDLHGRWTSNLTSRLNQGLLPDCNYAQIENHTAPHLARPQELDQCERPKPRTVTIRHTSGHRIIALIEIVSPSNKANRDEVRLLTEKVVASLSAGIHVAMIDLLPPGTHNPQGMHGATMEALGEVPDEPMPESQSLEFITYAAHPPTTTAYEEYRGVVEEFPQLPLFLTASHYIHLPLSETYASTVAGMAPYWRDILEARSPE